MRNSNVSLVVLALASIGVTQACGVDPGFVPTDANVSSDSDATVTPTPDSGPPADRVTPPTDSGRPTADSGTSDSGSMAQYCTPTVADPTCARSALPCRCNIGNPPMPCLGSMRTICDRMMTCGNGVNDCNLNTPAGIRYVPFGGTSVMTARNWYNDQTGQHGPLTLDVTSRADPNGLQIVGLNTSLVALAGDFIAIDHTLWGDVRMPNATGFVRVDFSSDWNTVQHASYTRGTDPLHPTNPVSPGSLSRR